MFHGDIERPEIRSDGMMKPHGQYTIQCMSGSEEAREGLKLIGPCTGLGATRKQNETSGNVRWLALPLLPGLVYLVDTVLF